MPASATSPTDLPVVLFESPEAWAAWLAEHHAASEGVYVRIAKKGAPFQTPSYTEALDAALCYGWIDSRKDRYDADSWLQRFTPRRARSPWSQVNRDKVEALVAAGQMKPAGLRAVDAAKADGRWDAAYASQSRATVPDDLQAALDASPEARAFFETLTGANRYAILYRVQAAKKPETRARRIAQFVAMLERHETIHP